MKLRTRLAVAFLTITIVPMLLFYLLVLALSNYQTRSFTKEYGLTEQVDLFSGNSMQIFNRITKRSQEDIRNTLDNDPGLYNDLSYLDKVNAELKSHYAYLIVRKGDTILYCGDSNKAAGEAICAQLPRFDTVSYTHLDRRRWILSISGGCQPQVRGGCFRQRTIDCQA